MARALVRKIVASVVGERIWRRLDQLRVQRKSGDLTWLAQHFRSDKWGAHRYTPHYQRHFEQLRRRPVNVLEIGIGGDFRTRTAGASLRMWKHYFSRGSIYGLDIDDRSAVEEPRIRVFQGDQSDVALLQRIAAEIGRLDIVIDDGSHRPAHVRTTFETLFPLLADDGIYVIEDTQTSYWPEWGGSDAIDDPQTSMAMVKRLVDGLNYEEFVDDSYRPSYTDEHVVGVHAYHNLVFVQKGTNREGSAKRRLLRSRYATKPH